MYVSRIGRFVYTPILPLMHTQTPLSSDYLYYAQTFENGGGYYSGIQPHPNGAAVSVSRCSVPVVCHCLRNVGRALTGAITKSGSSSTSTTIGFIEKFSGIETCGDIPDVSVKYSNVSFGDDNPSSRAEIWPSSNGGSGIYTCLGVTPAKSVSTVGQFNIASGDSTVSPVSPTTGVSPTTPVSPEPDPPTSILKDLGDIFGS